MSKAFLVAPAVVASVVNFVRDADTVALPRLTHPIKPNVELFALPLLVPVMLWNHRKFRWKRFPIVVQVLCPS